MEKIPTAEEFWNQHFPSGKLPEYAKSIALEFTKMHVSVVLRTAAKNVGLGTDYGESWKCRAQEEILGSYPLENIR